MKEQDICNIIAEALSRKKGSVGIDDSMETIQEWDSLGFLSILGALEKNFGNRVAAIDDLAAVRSVREIINIFKRENIV